MLWKRPGKSSIKTVEELDEVVRNMTADQRQVYDSITAQALTFAQAHKAAKEANSKFKPTEDFRRYVCGGPGRGKSYLIKALMGFAYIQTEVYGIPMHFLLGAPTSIASCNVSGATCHIIFGLPITHADNKGGFDPFKPLSGDKLKKLQVDYANVCFLIIDEVSLLSNYLLFYINLRMQEIFKCDRPFGGIPVLFFGDFAQLEPIAASPIYIPLSKYSIARITSGAPTSCDLWQDFETFHLKTNHRAAGDRNKRWREIVDNAAFGNLTQDDVALLRTRLVDTKGATTRSALLRVFVDAFLAQSEVGTNPICLLEHAQCARSSTKR